MSSPGSRKMGVEEHIAFARRRSSADTEPSLLNRCSDCQPRSQSKGLTPSSPDRLCRSPTAARRVPNQTAHDPKAEIALELPRQHDRVAAHCRAVPSLQSKGPTARRLLCVPLPTRLRRGQSASARARPSTPQRNRFVPRKFSISTRYSLPLFLHVSRCTLPIDETPCCTCLVQM